MDIIKNIREKKLEANPYFWYRVATFLIFSFFQYLKNLKFFSKTSFKRIAKNDFMRKVQIGALTAVYFLHFFSDVLTSKLSILKEAEGGPIKIFFRS